MQSATLQPVTFTPSAPVRTSEGFRNTLIEDVPQQSLRRAIPQPLQSKGGPSSMNDNLPTPRAAVHTRLATTSESDSTSSNNSDSESDHSSIWSKGSPRSFDELYDISESDSEEVPIKLSSSVKKRVAKDSHTRYPSIVIPSPGRWPHIDKLRSSAGLSPSLKLTVSPSILDQFHQRALLVPSTSSTPSLDGSLTSEELAASSCPSTPDIQQAAEGDEAWEPPVQLDPSAFSLLQHINGDDHPDAHQTLLEIPLEAVVEMKEILDSPPATASIRLNTSCLAPHDPYEAGDELSALSVPSPGGFFASLDSNMARKTWNRAEDVPTTGIATEFYGVPFRSTEPPMQTCTATSFYNVPWRDRPDGAVEHIVDVPLPSEADPITARKIVFSPTDVVEEVDEIDETYGDALQQNAGANINRTQLWLSAQDAYMQALCESDEGVVATAESDNSVPKTPDRPSPLESDSSPGKKSVRFAESVAATEASSDTAATKRVSPIHDGTFWEAWRHTKRSQRARDVFQHRQARAEAEHVRRVSLPKQHAQVLTGKYQIDCAERPMPQRPVSSFLPTAPEDEKKELIAQAEREQQALEQLQSSSWHLAALKEINGGKLLTSPVVDSFKGRQDVRILDLAGQVQCSWAWTVALDHPQASIYTTVSTDAEAHVASLEGPSNHFVVSSPHLWELPFENDHFDIVSARNLYAHLRTTCPEGAITDEWDLTLQECLRVLKPGGYLEFDMLEAELVQPSDAGQALGVEFAFNLRTRGYEPCSGKTFIPRLRRVGFCEIKRAWLVLPAADVVPCWTDASKRPSHGLSAERSIGADGTVTVFERSYTGSTQDVRAMTGLLGARNWEQWMLKLSNEMGRPEKECLADIAKALGKSPESAGWKCLIGWARKEM